MLNIKKIIAEATNAVTFVNIPVEYKTSKIHNEINNIGYPNIMVVSNKAYSIKNLIIYQPKESIFKMHNHKYSHIVIVDVYSFDKQYGHLIEYILQFRTEGTKIIYFAHICNFLSLADWTSDSKIINYQSNVSFNVIGYENSKNDFSFEMKLNYKINPFLNGQTIIYCATQKNCKIAAEHLLKDFCQLHKEQTIELDIDDLNLRNCMSFGIAYYTHEISDKSKKHVVDMYMTKKITVLFTCNYIDGLIVDTIIFKTTKLYKELVYQERNVYDIIKCCQAAKPNANIYIMTTKEMHKWYKNILDTKAGLDYSSIIHIVKDSKIEQYYNFSSLEHHLHEYVLYRILYTKDKDIEKHIKGSYFFYIVIQKKITLNFDMLIEELINYLCIHRLIYTTDTGEKNVNMVLFNIFFSEKMSFDFFVKLIQVEGNETNILTQISEHPEMKCELISKIKYNKQEVLLDKLYTSLEIKRSTFGCKLKIYIGICFKIKTFLLQNLGKLACLYSVINSNQPQKRKLDYRNLKDHWFQSNSLTLSVENDKCKIEANDDRQYHFIIERGDVTLLQKQFYNNYECELECNSILYCICVTDYNSSAILMYEDGCFNIVHRYYGNTIKKYAYKQKMSRTIKEKTKRVQNIREYKGIKIEFTAPLNITLPEWFSK